jgi:hypothetical protein
MSQTMGEVTVQRESALPWTWLESLMAPDDLGRRVRDLAVPEVFRDDPRAAVAIATARRYATGWRPEGDARIGVATGEGPSTDLIDDSDEGDASAE